MAAVNYQNYGFYERLAKEGFQNINTNIINSSNITNHIYWIANIMRDGIETEEVISMCIGVTFSDNYYVELYITDYFFNLIWWNLIVSPGSDIKSKYIYFPENQTNKYNKTYIDEWFIEDYYGKIHKIIMNNIIDDTLALYRYVNDFSLYLCNTISLKDDINLMNTDREVYDIIHSDLSDVPLDKYNEIGMERTNRLIDIIKNHEEHWASQMFRASEGINSKQYKENNVNIGPKPNGEGGVYPIPINSNLLYIGALKDLAYAIIDYSGGRIAQIINKKNVGISGSFARILKLNCIDIFLHEDPSYICNTKNFCKITIKNEEMLKLYDGMTYREKPKGLDKVLRYKYKHLIGKTLYFRSAMTCASNARGEGICHACYGRLSFINSDINIGIMSAEEFSSVLTQRLLSAKHLLEAKVRELGIVKGFEKFFTNEYNYFTINKNNAENYSLVINVEDDIIDNEEYDNADLSKWVLSLSIKSNIDPNERYDFNDFNTEMYISQNFYKMLTKYADDGVVEIPLSNIDDEEPLFIININNNELSETLARLQKIINNSKVTTLFSKDEILQEFTETIINSKINVNATHCAVILSEQIRDAGDSMVKPLWEYENIDYTLLTLQRALKSSPSITKRLNYNYVSQALITPSSFKINTPSEIDLYFMTKPQEYIDPDYVTPEIEEGSRPMVGLLN